MFLECARLLRYVVFVSKGDLGPSLLPLILGELTYVRLEIQQWDFKNLGKQLPAHCVWPSNDRTRNGWGS